MLTLHEAIREIQKELQISSEERIQAGDEPCFITDKLTIELTCTFSEKKSSKSNAGLNILSVLTVDSGKDKDISTDFIHKITWSLRPLVLPFPLLVTELVTMLVVAWTKMVKMVLTDEIRASLLLIEA